MTWHVKLVPRVLTMSIILLKVSCFCLTSGTIWLRVFFLLGRGGDRSGKEGRVSTLWDFYLQQQMADLCAFCILILFVIAAARDFSSRFWLKYGGPPLDGVRRQDKSSRVHLSFPWCGMSCFGVWVVLTSPSHHIAWYVTNGLAVLG